MNQSSKFMIKRLYIWFDSEGEQQWLQAKSYHHAKQILLQKNIFFLKLKFKGYFTAFNFKRSHLILIIQQLSTMLKAGLPLIESLTILYKEQSLIQWQWWLQEIKKQILYGQSVSQALARYPEVFPKIYCQIIEIGELIGQLDLSFENVASQLEQSEILNQRIKKAMRYPLFLLTASLIVSSIMLLFVLPQFAEVYQNYDAKLPLFTQMMIDFSNFLILHFSSLIISLAFVTFLLFFPLKSYVSIKIQRISLHLPVLGKLLSITYLSQIFQTLFIIQQSGIPLLSGLETAHKSVNHLSFKQSLIQIIHAIEQGNSFSQAISQQKLYPSICSQLIRVGEESGTLELMLKNLSEYYGQKSLDLTDDLTKKIEPLMMTIMAIIVGSLVIAMYLPIFQLGSIIH